MANGTYSAETQMLIGILSSRPIAYHPALAKIFGGVTCAVLLSQLLYWHGKQADPDGWIKKTVKEIEDETGLSESQQETARSTLLNTGAISYIRKGVPAMPFYRVNHARMVEFAMERKKAQIGQNTLSSSGRDSGDLLVQNALTNTTYITTENTLPDAIAPDPSVDYLQDLFERKKEQAKRTTLINAINQRVKNQAHRDACLDFAKYFPDTIFDYGEWIGVKGANIEKFMRYWTTDQQVIKKAIELSRKAFKENSMFAVRSPVMFVPYLDAARADVAEKPQQDIITLENGIVIHAL